jgi:hypothetical protein
LHRFVAEVRTVDGLGEIDKRDLRVDGRAVETRVTEELLDVTDVGAPLQEMRRAGMPELVRRERLWDLGAARMEPDEILDVLRAHASAVLGEKERRFGRILQQHRPCRDRRHREPLTDARPRL